MYRLKARCNLSSHDWFSFQICRQREALLRKTVFYFVRACTTQQLRSRVITRAHRGAGEERAHTCGAPSVSSAFRRPRLSFSPLSLPSPSSSHLLRHNVQWEYWDSGIPLLPTRWATAADEHHVDLWRYHRTELWHCRLLCVWRAQIHLSLLISRFAPSNITFSKITRCLPGYANWMPEKLKGEVNAATEIVHLKRWL